ncbi:MAG: PHP domain-containing protein [Clostridia bacterium]|nr:PHP domain-containing protein [Clostridia bacterium]
MTIREITRIDLHMHSTVSDGTDAPEEILIRVREAGIGLFSITDHDAMSECARIRSLLAPGDPVFLNGVEFSCRDREGKYHILGYGFDPGGISMRDVVEKGHRLRMEKAAERLDRLRTEFGFSFPEEEIRRLMALNNPGKPHIGNLMVKYGYAENREAAIREYIDRVKTQAEYIRPEEAIEGILRGGGIPVLAHPPFGSGRDAICGVDLDRRLRRLMDFGLRGLEGFYSGYTPQMTGEMLSLAEKYGLYVTAGSDYHGRNKQVILGDTHFDPAQKIPDGLRRFLEDVRLG